MNIISHKKVFLSIAVILMLASIGAVIFWGLPLGIDFEGGSLLEVQFLNTRPGNEEIRSTLEPLGVGDVVVQPTGEIGALLRFGNVNEETHQSVLNTLKSSYGEVEELKFESIGPVVGQELKQKAVEALIIVVLLIVLYIAWAFRKVSRPVSSWKYGLAAILALVHDVTIPTGVVAVIGQFTSFQVDAFFITALLTILGFSVHDTIVVFDRIRENLRRYSGKDFDEVANMSINEVLARSINTSLTLLFVLIAVLFFGGDTTKNLVFVLVIGAISGTYSSIFVASPLLTLWAKSGKNN